MSNPSNPYNVSNLNINSGNSRELSMRQELINTFYGTSAEIGKSARGILRKIRLDASGKPTLCPCTDKITKEQDKDYYCPICMTERYLFDEIFVDFYKVQHATDNGLITKDVGLENIHTGIFYVIYNANITEYDKIIEINLNDEGNIVYPLERVSVWQITELVSLRLDTARLEFLKIYARHEDVKYLKAP